jgi:hypothetical protein
MSSIYDNIEPPLLPKLVTFLREHDALCVINPDERRDGAQIICSMGLFRV